MESAAVIGPNTVGFGDGDVTAPSGWIGIPPEVDVDQGADGVVTTEGLERAPGRVCRYASTMAESACAAARGAALAGSQGRSRRTVCRWGRTSR